VRNHPLIAAATVFVAVFAFTSTTCVAELAKADDLNPSKVAPDELYVMLFRGVPPEDPSSPIRDHVLTLRVQTERDFSVWLSDGFPKLDGIITVKDSKLHAKISANFNVTSGTFNGPIEKDTPFKPSQFGFGSGILPFYFIVTSDPMSNIKKEEAED